MVWRFTFQVDPASSRTPASDFDWVFTGGTPATATDTKGPVVVTYASAGNKTATLNVTGVGTPNTFAAGGTPNGAYPITVVAVGATGGQPRMVAPGGDGDEIEELPEIEEVPEEDVEVEEGAYDPGEYTVAEVQEYVTDNPDEALAIYDAEIAGKNRSTLVTWLEEQIPFDPGAYTIDEVKDYVTNNPSELDAIYEAEVDGKNRVTLVTWLEEFEA